MGIIYILMAIVAMVMNAAAAADVSHPVKQGLVQMLSVFIDTILVCTATAMMCLNYIAKRTVSNKAMNIFRITACVVVFLGALLDFSFVWNLSDVLMGIMALINLPVIVILGKTAIACLNDYISQRKQGKEPEFKAESIGLKGKTEFWN